MDIVHRADEVMKLRTRLANLLQLALQPTIDMTKRQLPAHPRGSDVSTFHPAHPSKILCLRSLSPTNCILHGEQETPELVRLRVSTSADS